MRRGAPGASPAGCRGRGLSGIALCCFPPPPSGQGGGAGPGRPAARAGWAGGAAPQRSLSPRRLSHGSSRRGWSAGPGRGSAGRGAGRLCPAAAGVERCYAAPRSGPCPVAAPGGVAAGPGRVPRGFVAFSRAAAGRGAPKRGRSYTTLCVWLFLISSLKGCEVCPFVNAANSDVLKQNYDLILFL